MKNALLYSLFISIFCISLQTSAQCTVPDPFLGNTGSNMTVMLTPALIVSLNATDENAYLVALSTEGVVIGSQPMFGVSQTTIAVWGDDSQTPESDGAAANELVSFQLVNGADLFDVEMPVSVNYTTNALAVQPSSATLIFNCGAVIGCTDSSAVNFNEEASIDDGSCVATVLGCTNSDAANFNVNANLDDNSCAEFCSNWFSPFLEENQTTQSASLLLSEAFVLSLNAQSSSAYIVAVTPTNLVVGSSLLGQTQQALVIWPDDLITPEIDGASDGELINFYLIDDETVYLLDLEYTFATNGIESISSTDTPSVFCLANGPLGCTDNTACNFNAAANTNDGSCNYPLENLDCEGSCLNDTDSDGVCNELEIVGCQDSNACNFNVIATDSDDSCELPVAFYNCQSVCLLDADSDGVCDELEVVGCQDETACNFDASATDQGSCTFVVAFYDCSNECLLDTDSDGVCDELEIEGCQDNTACNYSIEATDAGSCEYEVLYYTCEDVCINDTDLDGVCDELEITGCQDQDGCNYNPLATDSDACTYTDGICETCVDGLIIDNDSDDDFVCDVDEITGCTDDKACNYDSNTTTDTDNSICVYIDGCQECSGEQDGSGIVLDLDVSICAFSIEETIELSYSQLSIQNSEEDSLLFVSNLLGLIQTQLELPEGTVEITELIVSEVRAYNVEVLYVITLSQDQITGLNVSVEQFSQNIGATLSQFEQTLEDSGSSFEFIEGCTSSDANNFEVDANINNGSCEFTSPGCGVSGACNFNPELNVEYSDFNLCVFVPLHHFCSQYLLGDSIVFTDGGCINDVNEDDICDEIQEQGCTDANAYNFSSSAVLEDGSCTAKILGCMDNAACNFDSIANTDNANCEFPLAYYDCSLICLLDEDNDGVCDSLEVNGCTNSVAGNYNPLATEDDNSCEIIESCGDSNYLEYNFNADVFNQNLCIELIVSGCMDVKSCNFDPLANVSLVLYDSLGVYLGSNCENPLENYNCNNDCINDADFDGVCDEDELIGCSNPLACNFDSLASEIGDCFFAEDFYDCDQLCLLDLNLNGVCDELEVAGCIDQAACNFDQDASITDTLYCEYPKANYLDCNDDCLQDIDNDGICDVLEVDGCTNELALNFNPYATNSFEAICEFTTGCNDPEMFNYNPLVLVENNASCIPFVQGCLDSLYLEFNPLANQDNGSCNQFVVYGCSDSDAVNYNSFVNSEDYSCQYAIEVGCMDSLYLNFSPNAVLEDPSMCGALIVYGCTNPEYLEYNPQATVENGDCLQFPYEGCTDDNYLEYNSFYNVLLEGSCINIHVDGCMDSNAYNYNPDATIYLEEEEPCILFGCTSSSYAEYYTQGFVATNSLGGTCIKPVVFGCTNPVASSTSYNPLANVNQVSALNTESPCVYNAGAVVNFTTQNTGSNMSVLVPYSIILSGDFSSQEEIPDGSVIGAFYTISGQTYCGGVDVWNRTENLASGIENIGIEIYGDDELTTLVDGFLIGESMQWMLLTPNGLLYSLSPVYNTTASSGSGSGNIFGVNAFSVMIQMDVNFMYQMPVVGCMNPLFLDYNPNATANGVGGFDNGEIYQDLLNNETLVAVPDGLDDDNMYDLNDDGQANPGCFVLSSYGCMDPLALNYNAMATIPDDSCIPKIIGCTNPLAFNYITPLGNENVDVNFSVPELCIPKIKGCMSDVSAFNFTAPIGDPYVDVNTAEACVPVIVGCTDPLAFNYNYILSEGSIVIATGNPFTTANTEYSPSLCFPRVYGCIDPLAFNFDASANTSSIHQETGSSICYPYIYGCSDESALNYQAAVNNQYIDINSPADSLCVFEVQGCTDPNALNYSSEANLDNNTCIAIEYGCMDPSQQNYNPLANVTYQGACIPVISGCLNDVSAFNYVAPTGNPYIDVNTQSECIPVLLGCTDPSAHENSYSINANTDNGSCYFDPGCMDATYLSFWTQGYTADFADNSCGNEQVDFYCSDDWYLEYYSEPNFGSEPASGNFAHISACQNELVAYCNDSESISFYPTGNVLDGNAQEVLNANFGTDQLSSCSAIQISTYCNNPAYTEYYGTTNSVQGANAEEEGGNVIDNSTCITPVDFYCNDANYLSYYAFDAELNDYSILLTDTGNVLDTSLCETLINPYCNDSLNTSYYNGSNITDGLASDNANIIDANECNGLVVDFYCNDPSKIGYYNLELNASSESTDQFVGTIINDLLVCGEPVVKYCNNPSFIEHYSDLASLTSIDPNLWNLTDSTLCENEVVFGCMLETEFNYNASANVNSVDFDNQVSPCYPYLIGCTDNSAFNYNDYDNNGSRNEYNFEDITLNINTNNSDLCVPIIEGCLSNPFAFNYPTFTGNVQTDVNTNNTDLCIDVIEGCMNVSSFNYNEQANTPLESSCIDVLLGCMDSEAFNYAINANTPDECIEVVLGCTNPISLNFNANANTNNANCIDVVFGCNDNGQPFSDLTINATGEAGNDGVDDDYQYDLDLDGLPAFNYYESATYTLNCIPVIAGCLNPIAFNFNPQANISNASCLPVIKGCTDASAVNFDANANTEFTPSTCEESVLGCLNPNAINYNCVSNEYPPCFPNCNFEDDLFCDETIVNVNDPNTCIPISLGCTDITSINYVPEQNANVENGSCVSIVFGCTTTNSINFDPNANSNDFSCLAIIEGCIDNGQAFLDLVNNTTGEAIPDGIDDDYQYDYDDDGEQALNFNPNANLYDYTGVNYEFACVPRIFGCTNSTAINYSIEATISNGSCIAQVSGCIDNGEAFLDVVNNITGEAASDGIDDDYQWDINEDANQALNYNPSANLNDNSCITLTYGCMVVGTFNYNPNATVSDGSCLAIIEGCTSANSLNFNPQANVENGSCIEIVYGCLNQFALNFDPEATVPNGTCIAIKEGCTSENAINFNANANTDDGSCIIIVYGCMNELASNYNLNATVADGTCMIEVLGCTDDTALNYNPTATVDNGSCEAIVFGCMNAIAFNYNLNANIADGTCLLEISGCTDALAVNFNPAANSENGSCVSKVLGCNIPTMFNFSELANFNDGTCIPIIQGCTDLEALNYNSSANTEYEVSDCIAIVTGCMLELDFICNFNPLANVDDNSCESSSCLRSTRKNVSLANPVCVDPISENYFPLLDSISPSSDWATSYFNPAADNFQSLWVNQYYIDEAICEYIEGCTDVTQLGFDSNATLDDGSCIPYVYGCLDVEYVEYNEAVNTSDNSCTTLKVFGCNNVNSFNYNAAVTILGIDLNNDFIADTTLGELNDPCLEIIYGCTDPLFVEYWISYDSAGDSLIPVSPLPNTETYNSEGVSLSCLNILTLGCTDSDYLNYWSLDNNNQVVTQDPVPNFDDESCTELLVFGCLDQNYVEYNSNANADQFISEDIPSRCINEIVSGCLSSDYIEYNALANTDDGSCEVLIIEGCTDNNYIEFWQYVANDNNQYDLFTPTSTPNVDNNTCSILIVRGCNITTAENYYLNNSETSNSVNVLDNSVCEGIVGCMNINASNYNPLAVTQSDCAGCTNTDALNWNSWADLDDGTCEIVGCTDNGLAVVDAFNNDTGAAGADGLDDDGIYDLDGNGAAAANYNASATINDFSCLAEIIEGCTDPLAFNYCDLCNVDDNSCIAAVEGCTDSLYVEYYDWSFNSDTGYQITNFSTNPNIDNGSCDVLLQEGCTLFEYLEFDENANLNIIETCVTAKVYGCLNPMYLEYEDGAYNATFYTTEIATQEDVDNGLASTVGESIQKDVFCFTYGLDGCTDANYIEYNPDATTDNGTCLNLKIEGCTEENSINFDETANTDDGSCISIEEGCTDQFAFNYSASANTEDGSCIEIILGCPNPDYLEHYNYNETTFLLDTLAAEQVYNTDAYSGNSYCQNLIIEGCTNNEFIEYYDYDAANFELAFKSDIANVNNGSCVTPVITACINNIYLEYSASANVSDPSACQTLKIEGCTDQAYLEYWAYDSQAFELTESNLNANFDDGSCTTLIEIGCLNEFADNYLDYVGIANVNDISLCEGGFGCLLPQYIDYNETYIGHDQSKCTAFKVFGCIDATAFNFDALANINGVDTLGGTDFFPDVNQNEIEINPCYPIIQGCTDSTAFNYIPFTNNTSIDVNTDDQSCYPIIFGCTDASAFNFIPLTNDLFVDANTDDNSCYEVKEGCLDVDAYNFNDWNGDGISDVVVSALSLNINTNIDSLCVAKIFGCLDANAFNYNSSANTQAISLTDSNDPCIPFIYGCTDETKFNFDAQANTNQVSLSDSKSPCYAVIFGCTDVLADNFITLTNDSLVDVNTEDGSCNYLGCMNNTADNYSIQSNVDDGSCVIKGCTISLFSNYNPAATQDDGTCSNSSSEVYGCSNENFLEYFNYDASNLSVSSLIEIVTIDNGTCLTPIEIGCSMPGMFNYNTQINVADDSLCIEIVEGCTNPLYTEYWNYDALSLTLSAPAFFANTDNGSCSTLIINGCTLEFNDQYDILANVYDTLSCLVEGCNDASFLEYDLAVTLLNTDSCITPIVLGCTDNTYIEYYAVELFNQESGIYLLAQKDNSANTDDGSCENLIITGCYYQGFENYNQDVNVYNFFDVPNTFELGSTILDLCGAALVSGCTDNTALNFNPLANVDADCLYTGCTLPFAFNFDENADIDNGSCIPVINGCTINSFLNYNLEANIDDGSCSNSLGIVGCTDSLFFEFNSLATSDTEPSSCVTENVEGCMDVNAQTWNTLATIHNNSLCTYEVISGCTSDFYLEYNYLATISVLSACVTPVINGCTQENSINFNSSANKDDGTCIEIILGCTNSDYLEYWDYNSNLMSITNFAKPANTDTQPSSCEELVNLGCTNFNYVEAYENTQASGYFYLNGVNTSINVSNEAACENIIVSGCIYDIFMEFNAQANVYNSGDCIYIIDNVCMDPLADISVDLALTNTSYNDGELNYTYQQDNSVCNYTGCTNPAFIEYQEYFTISDESLCETYKVVGCNNPGYIESYTDVSINNETEMYTIGTLNSYTNYNDDSYCLTPIVEGCAIWYYAEFNPLTNIVNNSMCLNTAVFGCSDPLADNFNSTANFVEDGILNYNQENCQYFGCTDSTYVEYWNYDQETQQISSPTNISNQDDGSCLTSIVFGCTLEEMYNFDASSNVNFASFDDLSSTCIAKTVGCTDELYVEFNPLANIESGLCSQLIFSGCSNSLSINYNPLVNTNDGSCIDKNQGCADNGLAFEDLINNLTGINSPDGYDDDYQFDYDSDGMAAYNYDSLANVNLLCQAVSYGCIGSDQFNFNSNANTDDGSCIPVIEGCLDNDFYNYNDYDYDGAPNALTGDAFVDINTNNPIYCEQQQLGCTDNLGIEFDGTPVADNLDANANTDNGSCIYNGCMDTNAGNYQSWATNPGVINNCLYYGCTDVNSFNYNQESNSDDGSCIPIVEGCVNSSFIEYWEFDVLANTISEPTSIPNVNNGSCLNLITFGCTNAFAINYNPAAVVNQISFLDENTPCIPYIFGCTESDAYNYNPLANTDNGLCAAITEGCMNPLALNYNSDANSNIGCILPIYGCTDITAFNYNQEAEESDGSCYPIIEGCVNPFALNYNAQANTNNGSCLAFVGGCMESDALNYSLYATFDNGSCIDALPGCTNIYAVNYDENANQYLEGSCSYEVIEVEGCMVPFATNYNPEATLDDGSCSFQVVVNRIVELVCIDPAALTYTSEIPGGYFAYADPNSTSYVGADQTVSFGWVVDNSTCVYDIFGCTNQEAINYNPNATSEDGSCILNAVYGCLNSEYLEYNELATLDTDPSSCVNLSVEGCNDPSASNFNPAVNISISASCLYDIVAGCTDADFIEYWDYDVTTQLITTPTVFANDNDGSCSTEIEFGCVDSTAFNYNENANVNQTSAQNQTSACVAKVFGCTDNTAFNFDSSANIDDSSCIAYSYGCLNTLYIEYNPEANADSDPSSCTTLHTLGCTDPLALNYNELASLNDNSCIALVSGCMDVIALNFNANANVEDNSCFYLTFGCTDENAVNFDDTAISDDGSCYGCTVSYALNFCSLCDVTDNTSCQIAGCTDINASNYDASATIDDGSYCSPFANEIYGCTDSSYLEYYSFDGVDVFVLNEPATHLNALVNTDNGTCATLLIFDCTNSNACNYNSLANVEQGNCTLPVNCDSCSGAQDGTGFVVGNDADSDGLCDAQDVVFGCADNTACNFNSSPTINNDLNDCIYTDGICETCVDGFVLDNDLDNDGVCNADEVIGCQDPTADNYSVTATDAADCIYNGCIDPSACNYSSTANTDDGTCTYLDGICETCENGVVINNDSDNDGLCDLTDINFGCTLESACNYNPSLTINENNSTCLFVDGVCDSCIDGEVVDNDTDNDGVCDMDEIVGCLSSEACNYNSSATDAGACEFANAICSTCEEGSVVIYDLDNDGLCDVEDDVSACTDITACNFDASPTVNTNNSICTYANDICETCSGSQDGLGTVVNNDQDGDGLCDLEDTITGCTITSACNYNSSLTINQDNTTCLFVDGVCDSCLDGVIVANDLDNDGVCDAEEILGCQTPEACNFNPLATNADSCEFADSACSTCENGNAVIYDEDSDGLCDIDDIVFGCTLPSACNYNSLATINSDNTICTFTDGICESCSLDENNDLLTDGSGTVIDNDSDVDGLCDTDDTTFGCTITTACNYNSLETVNEDNTICTYTDGICETCVDELVVSNDVDNDGICDASEIVGCQDELADNYNLLATDTGACIFYGCVDQTACNYSETANTDQGTCAYISNSCDTCSGAQDGTGFIVNNDIDSDGVCNDNEIEGCSQTWADNWNEFVTDVDDASCIREGCMVEMMFNYDTLATYDDGGCISYIYGCLDSTANNYNEFANDQGSSTCFYEGCMDSLYQNYNPIANIQTTCIYIGCTIEGSFNYEEIATEDDGSCFEIVNGCMDPIAQNYNDLANTPAPCEFVGCMEPGADNYVDFANIEDACYFYGCMNLDACNYSEQANVQLNNSCEFPEQYYDCDSVCQLDSNNNGICDQYENYGCTDSEAVNFNPLATQEDNSCYSALRVEDLLTVDPSCKEGFGLIQLTISGGLQPITVVNYTTYQANETIQTYESSVTIDNILANNETGILTYNLYLFDANGEGIWYPYTLNQPEVALEMTLAYDSEDFKINMETNAANYDIDWYFDNELLNDVSTSALVPTSNGIYGLLLTDEFGCSLYEEIEILDLSIDEAELDLLNVYPNPATDYITVSSSLLLDTISEIKLYDLAGNLVQTILLENYKFDFKVIDVTNFSVGTYIVSVGNKSSIAYTRMVVH